jgi:pimeloyl-ACP methyl ester carboxylesterase
MSGTKRCRTAVVSIAVAVLVGSGTAVAGAETPVAGTVPPADLPWAGCGLTNEAVTAGVQCASMPVPLDHDDPAGPQLQIALARVPATNPAQRIGSVFVNLGGPGSPVVEAVQIAGAGRLAALNERFDIVAFDPRGVGKSTPAIDCDVAPAEGPVVVPIDTVDALLAEAQRYVDACVAANGELLEHVSTADAARDLDLLRAAVGDEQLTYLGFSYGTFLGATYAALFPDRHRALVLDAALDPEQFVHDPMALRLEQLASFETALDRFLAACAADQAACSGFGGTDPAGAYDQLLAVAAQTPIPAEGYLPDPRPVVDDEILAVTARLLYSKQAWGLLGAALAQAAAGDASLFRALMDQVVVRREPDGSLDPFADRFRAISASDQQWPRDVQAYLELDAQERAVAPHFGGGLGQVVYALWPASDEDAYAGPFTVDPSSATPLVVGTTYDPATPYAGAVALVEQQGNSRLLTMDGDGHAAYGGNSTCIDSAVEAYLVDLVLPAEGTVCQQEVPFTAPGIAGPAAVARTGADLLTGVLAGGR